ncbi:MAG: hypothetical protein MUO21_00645 [Nitrososphaeraceae archaeon]|nr:hypothetical protein [Nitrososphaeraceae archaeon]
MSSSPHQPSSSLPIKCDTVRQMKIGLLSISEHVDEKYVEICYKKIRLYSNKDYACALTACNKPFEFSDNRTSYAIGVYLDKKYGDGIGWSLVSFTLEKNTDEDKHLQQYKIDCDSLNVPNTSELYQKGISEDFVKTYLLGKCDVVLEANYMSDHDGDTINDNDHYTDYNEIIKNWKHKIENKDKHGERRQSKINDLFNRYKFLERELMDLTPEHFIVDKKKKSSSDNKF